MAVLVCKTNTEADEGSDPGAGPHCPKPQRADRQTVAALRQPRERIKSKETLCDYELIAAANYHILRGVVCLSLS